MLSEVYLPAQRKSPRVINGIISTLIKSEAFGGHHSLGIHNYGLFRNASIRKLSWRLER